jgi:hypothetical protein
MTSPPARCTIKQLMAAVAVVASSLALYRAFGKVFFLLAAFSLCPGCVAWFATRGRRRSAAWGLAVTAAVAGVAIATVCVYFVNLTGFVLAFLATVAAIPLILGLGASWAAEATRKDASHRRPPVVAWLSVVAVVALTPSMLVTLWPLRLAFLVSRPAMDRLAARIAAGEGLGRPEWAGLYRVVATRREPRGSSVALIIDDNPAGASGFVRLGSPTAPAYAAPMMNLNFDEDLGGRWRYQNED